MLAEPVHVGDIHGVVSATGVVQVLQDAEFLLTAPQPARILEITRQPGDQAKAGDLLVRFEFPAFAPEAAARAATTRAADLRLQAARLKQTRVHALIAGGAVSRAEVAEADRELESAEAEAAQARAAERALQERSTASEARAPFDGIVTDRLHEPGESVAASANDPILRLIDPKQTEVVASVGTADLARFTVGARARVLPVSGRAPLDMQVVSRPAPEAQASQGQVRLAFLAPTDLPAGTEVAVEIDAEQRPDALLVPATSVLKSEDGSASVFIVSGRRAVRRQVVTGLVDAERVEIQSGLQPNDLVITQGQTTLKDGSEITIAR